MHADGSLVRCDVDAIDLVIGDEALQTLDLRAHALQHVTRLLRDCLPLLLRQLAGAGKFTLDHEYGHGRLLRAQGALPVVRERGFAFRLS